MKFQRDHSMQLFSNATLRAPASEPGGGGSNPLSRSFFSIPYNQFLVRRPLREGDHKAANASKISKANFGMSSPLAIK